MRLVPSSWECNRLNQKIKIKDKLKDRLNLVQYLDVSAHGILMAKSGMRAEMMISGNNIVELPVPNFARFKTFYYISSKWYQKFEIFNVKLLTCWFRGFWSLVLTSTTILVRNFFSFKSLFLFEFAITQFQVKKLWSFFKLQNFEKKIIFFWKISGKLLFGHFTHGITAKFLPHLLMEVFSFEQFLVSFMPKDWVWQKRRYDFIQ